MSIVKSLTIYCDNLECHKSMEFGPISPTGIIIAAKNRYDWIIDEDAGKHYCSDKCKNKPTRTK